MNVFEHIVAELKDCNLLSKMMTKMIFDEMMIFYFLHLRFFINIFVSDYQYPKLIIFIFFL